MAPYTAKDYQGALAIARGVLHEYPGNGLALYNIAYITPLVILLAAVSDRRVLGRLGRWNHANSPWVKAGLAIAVLAMSFGLLFTL